MSDAKSTGAFGRIAPLIVVAMVAAYFLWTARSGTGPGGGTGPATPSAERATPAPSAPSPGVPAPTASTSGSSPGAAEPIRAAPPERGGPAPASIRLGAWNIEWLGKPEDRSGPARGVAQEPAAIARYVLDSKASVIGLAEVVTQIPGRPIRSRELEAAIEAIERDSGQRWSYVLYPGRQDGDQLTGVMWDTGAVTALNASGSAWRQTVDTPYRVPVREGRSASGSRFWARPPHAMKFAAGPAGGGRTDFVVVMVHMKADYQGDFAAHRAQEMRALLDALPEVRRDLKDGDVVILGDTNVTSAGEAALREAARDDYIDLTEPGVSTTWRGGMTDRVMVPKGQPEFARGEFWVHSEAFMRAQRWSPQDFKRNLSDHFMVGTTLAVRADDD